MTAASRLQRYAVKLAAYDFEIEYVKSTKNCHADALSRLPLGSSGGASRRKADDGCSYLNYVEESFPLTFKEIKSESSKDPLLSKIYGYVMFGWPSHVNVESEKPYFNRKDNLHVDHGCLIWGYRIVIPGSLRETILKEIHDGHSGVVKMKQIARNYVWWETLDADIERVCAECAACRSQRAQPPPAPLHPWPWPSEPWSRLHLDFLGPFQNKYYLIIIDAHTKWIEVEKVNSTSASVVINRLRRLFARFGLPKRIVSDNGPPFSSVEFEVYLGRNGIKHSLTAPYHPATNGAAENAVRTIKRVLKKAIMENENDDTALSRFLFTYRNTEHSTTGREPAVAMFGRRLRGRLDLLRPDTGELVNAAQEKQATRRGGLLREAVPGDAVLVRDYSTRGQKWVEGEVVERSGPVSYVVRTDDGRVQKRHVDQLLTEKCRKSRHSLTILDHDTTSRHTSNGERSTRSPITEEKKEAEHLTPRSPASISSPIASTAPSAPTAPDVPTAPSVPTSPSAPTPNRERPPHRKAALRCFEKLKKI